MPTRLLPLLLLATLGSSVAVVAGQSPEAPQARALLDRGETVIRNQHDYRQAASLFRQAIEADPGLLDAHDRFIDAARKAASPPAAQTPGTPSAAETTAIKESRDRATAELTTIYTEWAKQHPDRAVFEFELGALEDNDWLAAEPHFRRALAIDPTFARAYLQLSLIADFRGENQQQVDLLETASKVDPSDPQYFFYYASAMKRIDPVRSVALLQQVADRYPHTERGAQGLYWAAFETRDLPTKVAIYERLRREFPPETLGWSASGMPELFQVYSRSDPEKALALADDMTRRMGKSDAKTWQSFADYAHAFVEARALVASGRLAEAIGLMDKTPRPARFDGTPMDLLKAQARDASGETTSAYDELAKLLAKAPTDALVAAVVEYGTSLGKSPAAVDADIWALREASAKAAPAFSLPDYPAGTLVSLDDYRGKVVLVNFWYPSCGPCRGEFPTLQRVFEKYKDRGFTLVAINVLPEEDALVMPYLRNNGFTFRSLKTNTEWAEKTYGARGYPSNFLVDAEGRIVFKPGVVQGADAERVLELEVEALLQRAERRTTGR